MDRLKTTHKRQEYAVMTMCEGVSTILARMEDACRFTERLLKNGNCQEMLLLKRYVTNQLDALISQAPNVEVGDIG